ncbi:aldehyde dehydrogenase family protein [Pseudomonas chlororaphis]|uniref:aldehyde dehydrogenase family protein n=1 Tax=Pseudomonas chlororaphis TaxID=587753 RepID=UPI000BE3AF48|nr:aldehyde dehydrogenase family protein [Pseudomonas chlororaphis]
MKISLRKEYGPYINGGFVPVSGKTFPAVNPATGEHLADIARCGAQEVTAAVQAARQAFSTWKSTTYEERASMLNHLADALESKLPRLAMIDAMDVGRRLAEIRLDYEKAIAQYRYFASAIMIHEGYGRPIPDGYMLAKREPIGVVGQIIPWNVPALMVALKVAPAIAAGNTVVLKPDENASLSTLEFAEIAGSIFPAGVINVVPGFGEEVGSALTSHPLVAKLAFTGSPEVGRIIGRAAAERLVPVSLELGGKSPNIVFPDIESLDAVVDNALLAAMYCNGQSCLAGTRLFVHDDIYAPFVDKLKKAAARLKVGDPLDERTHLSCLVSAKQGDRVLEYIEIGKREGAKVLFGGERVAVAGCEAGYFIQPTLLEVRNTMRVAQEEIFGPVLSVIRWNDYQQMLKEANDVPYGLAAGIYTSDLENAMRTADALEAGSVWINQYFNLASGVPFGGVKESGIGVEHAHETLNIYSQIKAITVRNRVVEPFYIT